MDPLYLESLKQAKKHFRGSPESQNKNLRQIFQVVPELQINKQRLQLDIYRLAWGISFA